MLPFFLKLNIDPNTPAQHYVSTRVPTTNKRSFIAKWGKDFPDLPNLEFNDFIIALFPGWLVILFLYWREPIGFNRFLMLVAMETNVTSTSVFLEKVTEVFC
ncbi:hypothetical protein CDAR_485761 [Caerostris darwini]|uniref:Uncharacterized protein n=1 Tax=Caerostris darwini TaxID=1538125 RepID=A0AAV4WK40_9ARAC|nr:hypothetical protein CDAR_485761 [Caerostris darwini]